MDRVEHIERGCNKISPDQMDKEYWIIFQHTIYGKCYKFGLLSLCFTCEWNSYGSYEGFLVFLRAFAAWIFRNIET